MSARRISAWAVLRSAHLDQWQDTGYNLLYNLVGGLLPVLAGVALLLANSQGLSLTPFARNGELALYTASLCCPALYLVVSERKIAPFPSRSLFVFLTISFVIAAVILYLIIAPALVGTTRLPETFNQAAFVQITAWLFMMSVGLTILITVLDVARANPAVDKITEEQQRKLEQSFDELEDK